MLLRSFICHRPYLERLDKKIQRNSPFQNTWMLDFLYLGLFWILGDDFLIRQKLSNGNVSKRDFSKTKPLEDFELILTELLLEQDNKHLRPACMKRYKKACLLHDLK